MSAKTVEIQIMSIGGFTSLFPFWMTADSHSGIHRQCGDVSLGMSSRLVINLLGYLGLAPFGVSAWLIISDAYLPDFDARFLFASYSATILTFLGGVLWGRGLVNADAFARNLMLILSNFFALLAWFSLVVWHTLTPNLDLFGVCLISLALGYLLVYVAETRLAGNATIKVTWPYSKMRLVLTALVVIMHGTVFIMR